MTSKPSSAGGSEDAERDERALRDELNRLVAAEAMPPDIAELRAALQQQLAQERGLRAHLRSRSTRARLAMAAGAVTTVAAVAALAALRPDYGSYPVERMVTILVFIAVVIGVELAAALWPLQLPPLPRWLPPAATAVGLCGLFVLYALPAAHQAHPASAHASGVHTLIARALPCLGIGGVVALALFAVVRILDRGGLERAVIGAAFGGLAANLALQLHCPITAPEHMLVGHFGVAVLLIAAVAVYRQVRSR